MYPLVLAMLMDLIVLICWSVISPVEYGRRVLDTTVDLNTGMVTINSAGTCSGGSGVSVWMFITPLLVIHVLLLVQSFVLYYEYRNCDDRYKQRKHSFNATLFAFQILLTGFPLLVAVHDNATSRYLIMFGIIFANDLGVISIVFFPIRSARKSCTEYQENAKADAYESRRLKKERKKMLAELKNTERNQLSSVSGSAIESEDLSRLYRLNPNFQKEDVESPEAMESKSISQVDAVCSSTNRAISADLPGDGFNNEVSSENQASTHISVETEGGKSSTSTSLSTSVGPKLKSDPGYYGFQY